MNQGCRDIARDIHCLFPADRISLSLGTTQAAFIFTSTDKNDVNFQETHGNLSFAQRKATAELNDCNRSKNYCEIMILVTIVIIKWLKISWNGYVELISSN